MVIFSLPAYSRVYCHTLSGFAPRSPHRHASYTRMNDEKWDNHSSS